MQNSEPACVNFQQFEIKKLLVLQTKLVMMFVLVILENLIQQFKFSSMFSSPFKLPVAAQNVSVALCGEGAALLFAMVLLNALSSQETLC